ncbi:MAG: cell division protein FtsW, partial [Pseudomonadota bacterium]|nr:cell division protein FtsW [Pseudomonadota bacterium]
MNIGGFSRTDHNLLARWWWTVDRWLLLALGVLIVTGTLLIAAASPPVAERIGLSPWYFINRHLIMLGPAVLVMLGVSLLSPLNIRRLALLVLAVALVLTALTP